MIRVGDIVKRISRAGQLAVGAPLKAAWLFYDGYFLVLQVETKVINNQAHSICLIMNDSGNTSWINSNLLKTKVRN